MSALERVTYVCIVGTCLIASVLLIERRLAERPNPSRPAEVSLLGKRLALDGVSWGGGRTTVVALMTTHCIYCEQSVPLYAKLSSIGNQTAPKRSTRFIVASNEPAETVKRYLSDRGVNPAIVVRTDFAQLGVKATPTVLVVDSQGQIRMVFLGRLSEAKENELLALL